MAFLFHNFQKYGMFVDMIYLCVSGDFSSLLPSTVQWAGPGLRCPPLFRLLGADRPLDFRQSEFLPVGTQSAAY